MRTKMLTTKMLKAIKDYAAIATAQHSEGDYSEDSLDQAENVLAWAEYKLAQRHRSSGVEVEAARAQARKG